VAISFHWQSSENPVPFGEHQRMPQAANVDVFVSEEELPVLNKIASYSQLNFGAILSYSVSKSNTSAVID
jgi:hypothetical protein